MIAIDRRLFLAGGAASLALLGPAVAAQGGRPYLMYHSPGCGCCHEWAKHIEAAFRRPLPVVETADIAAVKRRLGVPEDLQSCHTALIHGVVAEGHVPPADIRRLLARPDAAVRGLAVAGMPLGSPGMDVGPDRRQPYQVIAFGPRGRSVFARHG